MNPSQILLPSIFLFLSINHISSSAGITCYSSFHEGIRECDREVKSFKRWLGGVTGKEIVSSCAHSDKTCGDSCKDHAFYEGCCCDTPNCNTETRSGGERGKLTCKSGKVTIKTPSTKEQVEDEKECKACGMEKTKENITMTCFKRHLCGEGDAKDYKKACEEKGDGMTRCYCEEDKCLEVPEIKPPTTTQPPTTPAPTKPPTTSTKPQPKPDSTKGQSKTCTSSSGEDGSTGKGGGGMFPGIGVLALGLSLSLGRILALHESLQLKHM